MLRFSCLILLACGVLPGRIYAAPIADVPFVQEYAEKFLIEKKRENPNEPPVPAIAPNDTRAITVAPDGRIALATKTGLYLLHDDKWSEAKHGPEGPAFCLYADGDGVLWAGAWNGIYRFGEDGELSKEDGVDAAIATIGAYKGELIALGPDGFFVKKADGWETFTLPCAASARSTALAPDGSLYVATQTGLLIQGADSSRLVTSDDDIASTTVNAVATAKDGRVWLGCMGGIDVFESGVRKAHYNTDDGIPNFNVHCLAFDPDGTLWAGTDLGVVRFDGKTWSLRHTLRWLPDNDVRGIAFDKDGTAWIATKRGVGAIKRRTMTLADKADYYLDILRRRHVRPPGLVEKCKLPDPDDFYHWDPVDDDNDGSYTAMYMAAECLRYAVTKDPKAKQNADEAWEAIDFLHEVTGGNGFVARTVVPGTWWEMHDENRDYSPEEQAEERVENPRFKLVEKRWRRSEDGKWYWKGDTSSDEIVGHFYAFNMYYHFAADDDQKERVRELTKRLMDYIIDGDYTLIDPETGKHTLWGMWNPERLEHDLNWRTDAPINCTEMLSFLLLTQSITGDEKYGKEFQRLFNDYHFGERLTHPKSYGRTERTHIDDDLLSMVWPTYILHEKDPAVLALLKQGQQWAYSTIEHDVNPQFNFTYAWAGLESTHNDESVAFLRDTPLDLRQFSVDSSKREDVKIRRYPMMEVQQTDRILPPSERGTMRWDKNPWEVQAGDFGDPKGHMESSGTYWLLPYWLGRYLNIIGPPQG